MTLRVLTRTERVLTSLLAIPISALIFAPLFPLSVLLVSGRSLAQGDGADLARLWEPAFLFFVALFDGLIVLVLGVPLLALLGRLLGDRWWVAPLAGAGVITLIGGTGTLLAQDPTWQWDAFAFWAGVGMASAGIFQAVRVRVRRVWATPWPPEEGDAPAP